jgi:hypothetical protein
MLGFSPLCVAPLGVAGSVVDPDQADLQGIDLLGLDNRLGTLLGFDARAMNVLGISRRTGSIEVRRK